MIFCPYLRAPSQSCMYRQTPMAWYIMCNMYTLLSSNTELIFSWLSSQISNSSLGGAEGQGNDASQAGRGISGWAGHPKLGVGHLRRRKGIPGRAGHLRRGGAYQEGRGISGHTPLTLGRVKSRSANRIKGNCSFLSDTRKNPRPYLLSNGQHRPAVRMEPAIFSEAPMSPRLSA